MNEPRSIKSEPNAKIIDRTEALNDLVGVCDFWKVASLIKGGAFLECGRPKDLFVPVGEQLKVMKVGASYLVYVYRDEKTGRVAGSSKLNKYLSDAAPEGMLEGDIVDLVIAAQTDMGYKAVINSKVWGVLYKNEIFRELTLGQKIKGYIKKIRPDRRIDLSLQKAGEKIGDDLPEMILNHLKLHGGFASLTDKSPPQEIYRLFGVSKKKFKIAIGNLYKKRKLAVEPRGLRLIPTKDEAI